MMIYPCWIGLHSRPSKWENPRNFLISTYSLVIKYSYGKWPIHFDDLPFK